MKKLFIVFEGIDGSGTTTQAELLKRYFIKKSEKAVVTSEPSSGPIGNLIREGMKKRVHFTDDKYRFDEQMAYLFAADRHDHLYNEVDGVYKLLKKGCHVISTRYYFSSLAYHCDMPEEFSFVKKINEKFPNPDIVIYLDNPIHHSLYRMRHRSFADKYENKEKLIRVKENYDKIFSEYKGLFLKIRADKTINIIHRAIIKFIEGKIA